MLTAHETPLEGLFELECRVFGDDRGFFMETWRADRFTEATGAGVDFVQTNLSTSSRNVIRGLHFQAPPHGQGKLVRVARGRILDVAVDIRKSSPTYGQHHAVELDLRSGRQLWIPPGFAHGFLALEDDTVIEYACTSLYAPASEGSVRWDDPAIGIDWSAHLNGAAPTLSEKDAAAPLLADLDSPF